VVFGDSWGVFGAKEFQKMASSHGLTVDNQAISGTTAEQWAATPDKLTKFVQRNRDAKYVWVTIGGNDAAPAVERGEELPQIFEKIKNWIRASLDPLFAAVPDIKVVAFGYDILFWDFFECVLKGNSIFKRCGKHGQDGFAECANEIFTMLQTAWEQLDVEYKAKGFSLTVPNLLGSFQTAGGVPGASIGHYNKTQFSPSKFTDVSKVCLHANDLGYSYIFANLWNLYFSKFENGTAIA